MCFVENPGAVPPPGATLKCLLAAESKKEAMVRKLSLLCDRAFVAMVTGLNPVECTDNGNRTHIFRLEGKKITLSLRQFMIVLKK